jgi:hypothetical protein
MHGTYAHECIQTAQRVVRIYVVQVHTQTHAKYTAYTCTMNKILITISAVLETKQSLQDMKIAYKNVQIAKHARGTFA